MADIIADAKTWLAEQPQRTQTHSENCHKWHASCLVSRLLTEAERLKERVAVLDRRPPFTGRPDDK